MALAEFKTNFKVTTKQFKSLVDKINKEVIPRGLDRGVKESLRELKRELKALVSQQTIETYDTSKNVVELNKPQPSISVATSKEKIVEEVTNISLTDYNKNKDRADYYQSTNGPKLLVAQRSRNSSGANRITLRMPIEEADTVTTQREKAQRFFSDLVLGVRGASGDFEYTQSTENIADQVKIKCSKYKGDDDFEGFGGFSPKRRFERDRETKQYAEWTIPQETVNRITKTGVNISQIADNILNQEFEEAKALVRSVPRRMPEVTEKLEQNINKFEKEEDLKPTSQAINYVTKFINGLIIVAFRKETSVRYEVHTISNKEISEDFMNTFRQKSSVWKMDNADKWVKQLVRKARKAIRQFLSENNQ